MNIKELKKTWLETATEAVELFITKNFCDNETKLKDIWWEWIDPGLLISIHDEYFININDIFLDLEQDKKCYMEYYWYEREWYDILHRSLNYKHWLQGFRYETDKLFMLKKQVYNIEQKRKKETERFVAKKTQEFLSELNENV